jgi:hypothetical protein
MRTTLNLDPDVLRVAKHLASEQGRSLGEVVSDLARRGLEPRTAARGKGGFPVFRVSENAPPFTPQMVDEALDE